jgi:hypothetical protein
LIPSARRPTPNGAKRATTLAAGDAPKRGDAQAGLERAWRGKRWLVRFPCLQLQPEDGRRPYWTGGQAGSGDVPAHPARAPHPRAGSPSERAPHQLTPNRVPDGTMAITPVKESPALNGVAPGEPTADRAVPQTYPLTPHAAGDGRARVPRGRKAGAPAVRRSALVFGKLGTDGIVAAVR